MTDFWSVLDIVFKRGRTSEKRFLLHIDTAQEICSIGCIRSSHSLSDDLTKLKVQEDLYQLTETAYDKPMVDQLITLDPPDAIYIII